MCRVEGRHGRVPGAGGSSDAVSVGVATRNSVATLLDGRAIDLRAMMRAAPVIPDQLDAMDALGALRQAEVPMALVHDEYGHFEGEIGRASCRERVCQYV